MSRTVRLSSIAHARAGDKGHITNICLFPYDEKLYPILEKVLTADIVKEHFRGILKGDVLRYEVPNLKGFNFVLYGTREGGVSSSLDLDSHGKSLSYGLLELEVEIEV